MLFDFYLSDIIVNSNKIQTCNIVSGLLHQKKKKKPDDIMLIKYFDEKERFGVLAGCRTEDYILMLEKLLRGSLEFDCSVWQNIWNHYFWRIFFK